LQKRNTTGRREAILSLVSERQAVSVEELSQTFATSEVTIRKDLARMEQDGLLLRRYGGASVLPREAVSSKTIAGGAVLHFSKPQQAIVKAAAKLINNHSRIVIDSGSTTAALIPLLNAKQGLVVMTNSLLVANALNALENEPTLLMTGGTWDAHSCSFQGQIAESVLRSFDFDQLFIGADGIDPERGTTTFNELIGLSRVMADVSRQVIVMAEAAKFGRRIPNVELPWEMIDILLTEKTPSAEQVRQIEANNVRVIIAE
jgi:DeoR/GlpR family transcriptional regulator of sugar metabolism